MVVVIGGCGGGCGTRGGQRKIVVVDSRKKTPGPLLPDQAAAPQVGIGAVAVATAAGGGMGATTDISNGAAPLCT